MDLRRVRRQKCLQPRPSGYRTPYRLLEGWCESPSTGCQPMTKCLFRGRRAVSPSVLGPPFLDTHLRGGTRIYSGPWSLRLVSRSRVPLYIDHASANPHRGQQGIQVMRVGREKRDAGIPSACLSHRYRDGGINNVGNPGLAAQLARGARSRPGEIYLIASPERTRQPSLPARIPPCLADHASRNMNPFAVVKGGLDHRQDVAVAPVHLDQGPGIENEGHGP